AKIADDAFAHIAGFIRAGVSERDVALELEVFMRRQGAAGVSFPTIVASGERSALPHGVASDRLLGRGEFVTLDFGARYHEYASDITRTVVIGPPSDHHLDVYALVLRAQERALAEIRPGMSGEAADALARDVIEDGGYGNNFGHSLGHGLGLAVHEAPRLARKSVDVLQEGMVVTVEPGVYIPGFGGVRIEDDIVLTADGCTRLTHATKELLIL
ncbi:MAG: M24 family metallopeptidase, partial [Bacilli bacterium]